MIQEIFYDTEDSCNGRIRIIAAVVTHDERILDLMDKVYRLENGRLTEISNS